MKSAIIKVYGASFLILAFKEVMINFLVFLFIGELYSRDNYINYFHDFLDMIENNILVIEPASGEKARMPLDKIQKVLMNVYKTPVMLQIRNPGSTRQ